MDSNPRPQGTFVSRIGNYVQNKLMSKRKPTGCKQSEKQKGYNETAVDFLVKKLKTQPGGVEKLEKVLKTADKTSECVTISRTKDGRIEIMGRKELPHVIYCRVWRWQELQSHNELRAIKTCEFPWSAKKADICINPYHYERIENSLPPISVPRYSDFAPDCSILSPQQAPEAQPMPCNVTFDNNGFSVAANSFSPVSQYSSGQSSPMSSISSSSTGNQQTNFPYNVGENQSALLCQDNNGYMQYQPEIVQVPYEEPPHWATVAYYELNHRVGEQFRCATTSYSLTVDGFTYPPCNTSNRFCLGQLSNINRNTTIESTRKHIGKGLHIYWDNNQLFIRCLSESPIFVQSTMTNHLHNFFPNTVCKVSKDFNLQLFDSNEFADMLSQVVNSGFEATYALTKMCTIRISFVKGWGAQYHRQDITSTPCWIEIHLNGPLKWLDNILVQMNTPLNRISSVS